jgi:signal transduction histidine kinase
VTDKSTGDIYTSRLVLDCSQDAKTGQRMALLLVLATLAGGVFVAWAAFWRALSNLPGNAIRYAEPRTELCGHIEKTAAGELRLWVENAGPTVPAAQLPRLFDRFFRPDASRCEVERPHHGLGLSIVAAIARMHDGQPLAESAAGRTRVGFSLLGAPAASASEVLAING